MTDDEREKLKERLDALDKASGKILEARKPFDEALNAIDDVREGLLAEHDADVLGTCEHCMRLMFEGELGFRYEDGPIMCEACAPTWSDLKVEQDELIVSGNFEDSYEDAEAAKDARESVLGHIEAGDGDKRYVWAL